MDPTIEQEASSLGWTPQEKFRGDPEKWVDAATFVERGKSIMPLLKKTNQRLEENLANTRRQLEEVSLTAKDSAQTIKDLVAFQAEEVKRQVEARIQDLKAERKLARKEGDNELADELGDQITTLEKTPLPKVPEVKTTSLDPTPTPKVEPWAQEFYNENRDWMGKDKRRTALFTGIAEELHEKSGLRGRELLDAAKEELEKAFSPGPGSDKAEGGGRGGPAGSGGGNGSGTSYDDLPQDAKAVCNSDEKKFVGEKGKAFKTQKEWRAHYAQTYFGTN